MSRPETIVPTVDPAQVASIAAELAKVGRFVFDLEFVSEGRYVPELALIQLAWGDPDAPGLALIDPLAVDPQPVLDLIAREDVDVVAHAARQDLALLASLGVRAASFWDSQIAAAFCGHGEQVGYARLVDALLGIRIDKGAQFTNWIQRPLSKKQLRYAIDDVRLLIRMWPVLRGQLEGRGRIEWAEQESRRLAELSAERTPPDEVFRGIGGWRSLRGAALARLMVLAEWREREALATNTPPGWILPDGAMIDLSKRGAESPRDLRRCRGVGAAIMRKYGDAVVGALREAQDMEPPPVELARKPPTPRGQIWSALVTSLVAARCASEDVPARFVGNRQDADALVYAFETGDLANAAGMLLHGWRREFIGDELAAWLCGETSVAVDPNVAGGLKILPVEQ